MLQPNANGPRQSNPEPTADFDRASLRDVPLGRGNPAEIAVLHFGFKALCHALIAHKSLSAIEAGQSDLTALREQYEILDNPLSFSLKGAAAAGIITPSAVLQVSSQVDRGNDARSGRVRFCDKVLLEPLMTQSQIVARVGPTMPSEFLRQDWTVTDLLCREKMGAALLCGQRLFERALGSYRNHVEGGARCSGALDRFANYLEEQMAPLVLGERRRTSLAMGERYLLIFRGGAARQQPDAENTERTSHYRSDQESTVMPNRAAAFEALARRLMQGRGRTDSMAQQPEPMPSSSGKDDFRRLDALAGLREKLCGPDAVARAEAEFNLRAWGGRYSPQVEQDLNLTVRIAREVRREERVIDIARGMFEAGDCLGALFKLDALLKDGPGSSREKVRMLRSEAMTLRRLIHEVIEAPEHPRAPSLVWPDASDAIPLGEALHRAFMNGAEAEVFTDKGFRFYGKLACYVPSPSPQERLPALLSLFHDTKSADLNGATKSRPEGEKITWTLKLSSVVKINFFLYPGPPPQERRAAKECDKKQRSRAANPAPHAEHSDIPPAVDREDR